MGGSHRRIWKKKEKINEIQRKSNPSPHAKNNLDNYCSLLNNNNYNIAIYICVYIHGYDYTSEDRNKNKKINKSNVDAFKHPSLFINNLIPSYNPGQGKQTTGIYFDNYGPLISYNQPTYR